MEGCFNWQSVWKVYTHTCTDTASMHALLVFLNTLTHTPLLSLKKLTILLTMHCLHLFTSSNLPKVTISVCRLPHSLTLHGRDSLIKEQHYLRAAALQAVRNAVFSAASGEKESMPTFAAAYSSPACMARALLIAFNDVIVKHLVT